MTGEQRAKYHEYLEQLRASGRTNMFGAAPYLMSRFGLERRAAESVLLDWMDAHERTPAGAA